jgi:hypothetical protein
LSAPQAPAPLPPATASRDAKDAYDLSADLEARRADAAAELGTKLDSEVLEGVFLVVAPGGRGALGGAGDITRRSLTAYFNGRFGTRPARAISVYLLPNASAYERWCQSRWKEKCSSPYGFYLANERKIVMNVGLGIGTLTHELVHPLVEADFPGAPDWINEGIASLFEQFYLTRPGEIHGGKNWRLPRLRAALGSKAEQSLAGPSALFGMSDETFRGDKEDLHYASARYLCQWLDEKGLLWAFYQRWRDSRADDPSGEKAFEAVVGLSPADAEGKWRSWVRSL